MSKQIQGELDLTPQKAMIPITQARAGVTLGSAGVRPGVVVVVAAVARLRSLAWALPHAAGAATKKDKNASEHRHRGNTLS